MTDLPHHRRVRHRAVDGPVAVESHTQFVTLPCDWLVNVTARGGVPRFGLLRLDAAFPFATQTRERTLQCLPKPKRCQATALQSLRHHHTVKPLLKSCRRRIAEGRHVIRRRHTHLCCPARQILARLDLVISPRLR